ncbi:nuclear transport factor 2 family protein [Streptomyces sp. TRM70350]|uniref:nuclear transport factor 2 family protein n=1 Tax=Streptomyces sp. TRM70350 TaxID=2856165 RepID=UPI001C4916CA|nr:nuclear transport factor 2 family protein [Streptomyces sp. TRM70350]MBV7698643.1 nuclear transport factor 2 family protein [Streptomyces sp. TRM70350]
MTALVPSGSASVHPHVRILEAVYADLLRLADFAAPDIVLHPAHRGTDDGRVLRGKDAVLAHERNLVRATDGTLVMDTDHIVANGYFGAVLGTLRASRPRTFAMPFCGLWRFADGLIIEHWENAHAPHALQQFLAPPHPADTQG